MGGSVFPRHGRVPTSSCVLMPSGWLHHTKGSITVSMACRLPSPKVAFSESQGLEAPKNFQAQKGCGQEEVGFRRWAELQEASPLGSKVPSENLATIERGRAHYLAGLRPLLAPSNLSQPPSPHLSVNSVPFAHMVQLLLCSHRAQGVSRPPIGLGRGGRVRRSPEKSIGRRASFPLPCLLWN